MSSLFSIRLPCTPEGVQGWLRRYQLGVVCRPGPRTAPAELVAVTDSTSPVVVPGPVPSTVTENAPIAATGGSTQHGGSGLPPLPPFSDPSLPRHEGSAGGRNKRRDTVVFSNSADVADALHDLWETSGLTRFRDLRKALSTDALSPVEAEEMLIRELGLPVSDEVRSRCIREYNEYMDPCTLLLMCAACGVYEFNSVSAPLRSHDLGVRRVHLTPSIPIVEKLSLLRLTPEQVEQYHNIEPAYRKCFGVMQIVTQGSPQWYHLHSHLTSVDDAGKPIARLCSSCQEKVSQGEVPQFSLASGCDFGNPSALGLPELSLLEIQLIACYRVFANLVKLVAPFGMGSDTRQTAFSGHTIVFPHDGPAVCATKLPDLTNIHETVSVMFIGTKEQWTGNKHSLLNKFRGIFQVRPQVVLRWLQALKGVGNPLYKSIPIAASDDPCWRQMQSLPQDVLDRAQIADDPITSSIENFASSDVARVRAGRAHNMDASAHAMAAESVTQPSSSGASATAAAATGYGGLSSVFVSRPTDTISVFGARGLPASGVPTTTVDPSIRGRLEVLQSLHEAINGPALAHAAHTIHEAPVKVSLLSDVPLNEFTENDLLLNGSFSNLFFLGRPLPSTGSVSSAFRLKLLRQHDNRFARNHQLLFLLFNQLQRHTVARTVAARVRPAPGQIREFHRMVEESDFQRKLDVAIRQPDGDVADKLARRVLPMIQIAGAKQKSKMTVLAADLVSPKLRVDPSRMDVIPPQDKRVLAWELHRPLESDKVIVSFCAPMLAALGCNTALYMLGNTMQATAILFYLLKYMTKHNAVPTNCLSAVHEAQRHIKLFPSVAANSGDPVRTAQHFMNRLLNNISAKTEMSAEMASAALVGMPSTMASHDTAFCFIRQAIAFVKDSLRSLGSQRRASGGQAADDESSDDLYGAEPASYDASDSDRDEPASAELDGAAGPTAHSASATGFNDADEPMHPFER
jgi:hypothetical protein